MPQARIERAHAVSKPLLVLEWSVRGRSRSRRIVLDGVGENATSLDTIGFEAAGDGTRITYTADFKLKGVLRVAEPFLGGTFKALASKALAGLEAKLGASV